MKQLGRGYYIDGNVLYKPKIKEKVHLMHKYGGSPGIDAELYDSLRHKIDEIQIKTDTGKFFVISAIDFDMYNKEEHFAGHGRQYFVYSDKWTIIIPNKII